MSGDPAVTWSLAWRLARRELRSGVRGFRVFLACLTVGVAAIAAVGSTSSGDFPVASALQPLLHGPRDAFVTKLSPSGSALEFSTYLGGTQTEDGLGIDVDDTGHSYLTGQTSSLDFPATTGPWFASSMA